MSWRAESVGRVVSSSQTMSGYVVSQEDWKATGNVKWENDWACFAFYNHHLGFSTENLKGGGVHTG